MVNNRRLTMTVVDSDNYDVITGNESSMLISKSDDDKRIFTFGFDFENKDLARLSLLFERKNVKSLHGIFNAGNITRRRQQLDNFLYFKDNYNDKLSPTIFGIGFRSFLLNDNFNKITNPSYVGNVLDCKGQYIITTSICINDKYLFLVNHLYDSPLLVTPDELTTISYDLGEFICKSIIENGYSHIKNGCNFNNFKEYLIYLFGKSNKGMNQVIKDKINIKEYINNFKCVDKLKYIAYNVELVDVY